jgi:tRNA 2-thiocytidine biosynthesis protein TtcA
MQSESEVLERKLSRAMGRALGDFSMISEGDRILVAVSGGKDSYTMAYLLRLFQRKAPVNFEIEVVNIDQGHPGYPGHLLADYMEREGYPFRMVREDTYKIVTEKIPEGKTFCSLCSRLRRGILYSLAQELGCTKIALGHHRDDVLQTLLLNLLFAGKLGAMPPKLLADDGKNVVIRPLVFCAEDEIRRFSELKEFPILPCDLCGSQENLQRKRMGRLIDDLERETPGTKQIMLAALRNVKPSQLLDSGLWKTMGLAVADEREEQREGTLVPESRLRSKASTPWVSEG